MTPPTVLVADDDRSIRTVTQSANWKVGTRVEAVGNRYVAASGR